MERISHEVSKLAQEVERYFERRERDNGESFYCLGYDAPNYMSDIVRNVHGDMMPDDYVYEFIFHALDYIEEGYNVTDAAMEYADHYASNPELLDWVQSDLSRMKYVNRAMQGFGCDTLSDALSWGYHNERKWIFHNLISEMESYTFKLEEAEV